MYFNARSVIKKLDELAGAACVLNPDFILINESWGNGSLSDSFFSIPNFELILRKDRTDTSNGFGGGLLLYVKQEIVGNVSEFTLPEMVEFNQCCGIRVSFSGKKSLLMLLVYRPHHVYKQTLVDPEQTLHNNQQLCEMIKKISKPCVVFGDFNYSQIDWETMNYDASCEYFMDTVQNGLFKQHVNFPTHNSGTQPDIVLSSPSDLVLGVEDLFQLGNSDHSMIMTTISGSIPTNVTTEEVPDWRNADFQGLRSNLDIDWLDCLSNMRTLESWDTFKKLVKEAEEKSVPKKRRRVGSRPLWMQQNVMRIIRKKKRLWKTYKESKDYKEYLAYKKVEREVRAIVRKAKRKLERKIAKEARRKPKQFYSYIKSKTSNRQSVGPIKDDTGEIVSDNKSMAGILNGFFTSVFTKETFPIPEPNIKDFDSELSNVHFSPEIVNQKMNELRPDSASGPDNVSARTLKETAEILSVPLALLFARSLEEGVVPDDWRKANVTPIFKAGSKLSPGNYRPVSLTSIVCKVMESIIRDNIVDHLKRNHLIHASQHGFMSSMSCQTNLLEYLDVLTKLIDAGHAVDVLYLDFAKAFDKVPHQRLLQKLRAHGITGKVNSWIESWLSGRQQRVVINGMSSEWAPVTSGVPQGSVLGPTCFIIFINDIDEVVDIVNGFVFKFADDTKYGRTVICEEDRELMQNDIDRLLEWAERWQMEFNGKKCKVLHFGHDNPRYSYTLGGYAPGGVVLENVAIEKDIGVMIHESLKPSQQCFKAAAKGNQILGQITKSFHYRDKDTWIPLYKTYVRHHLEFSCQAWSPWLQKDIDVLEKVQMKTVDRVVGLKGKTYQQKLKEVKLLSLCDRRKRGDLIQVWKKLHGKSLMNESIHQLASINPRFTRRTNKPFNLAKPHGRLDIRRNFYSVRVVDEWNKLPTSIQNAATVDQFKEGYDKFVHNITWNNPN